jgi:hypothetical protein
MMRASVLAPATKGSGAPPASDTTVAGISFRGEMCPHDPAASCSRNSSKMVPAHGLPLAGPRPPEACIRDGQGQYRAGFDPHRARHLTGFAGRDTLPALMRAPTDACANSLRAVDLAWH